MTLKEVVKAQPCKLCDDERFCLIAKKDKHAIFHGEDVVRERLGWEEREKFYAVRLEGLEKSVQPLLKRILELENEKLELKQKIKQLAELVPYDEDLAKAFKHDMATMWSEELSGRLFKLRKELLGLSKQ
ncbi:MAG: hypothetical protein WC766_06220 [Patescibacteria group bacterium]|jgi:hypothetical protein